VRLTNQLLTLWYATEDAPAPAEGDTCGRTGIVVTVAAQPANPSNIVTIRYRVDGGSAHTLRAVRVGGGPAVGVEYHRAVFPEFRSGNRVEYVPVLSCSGQSVPDAAAAAHYMSSFKLERVSSLRRDTAQLGVADYSKWTAPPERFPFGLDYLATVHVPLGQPEMIGPAPEGIVVNWYWSPAEGVVTGPSLEGKVRRIGGDWMTIRRDGVGLMDVRATIETTDGALLWVEYRGYYELGSNGYQDFLDRRWPVRAPTRTTPRFHTSHSTYLWLNRVQCVGIGEVAMDGGTTYTYDLYALR
jgi:hypothetical protein